MCALFKPSYSILFSEPKLGNRRMDKNTNGADVEQGGSQEQGRRIPPARRAKQQGGKGGGSAEGKPRSSKQIILRFLSY